MVTGTLARTLIGWLVVLGMSLLSGPAVWADASGLSRAAFEASARSLMSKPALADDLLALCRSAAVQADGDDAYRAVVHGFTSHALWLKNRYREAEAEARKAVSLDPDTFGGYFFLTDSLNAQKRYQEAYQVCLIGARRRGGTETRAALARCREDFVRRVARSPAGILRAARYDQLPLGRQVFVRGRVHALRGEELIFSTPDGEIVCTFAPEGMVLHPHSEAESRKQPGTLPRVREEQVILIQGLVAASEATLVRLAKCTLLPDP